MDQQQRNLFIAIALSLAILFAFQFWFAPKRPPPTQQAQQDTSAPAPAAPEKAAPAPVPGMSGSPIANAAPRDEVLGKTQRITVATPRLDGSIALTGARLDDLT